MPSPFPGMNPYLEHEDAWHDFHENFMPRVRDVVSAQVDPRYIVKIDEHIYIHEMSAEQRSGGLWDGLTSRSAGGRRLSAGRRRRRSQRPPWNAICRRSTSNVPPS